MLASNIMKCDVPRNIRYLSSGIDKIAENKIAEWLHQNKGQEAPAQDRMDPLRGLA